MKAKADKIREVEFLKTTFEENPVAVLCSFQGIKVEEDVRLRNKIRETGAGYRVISNRVAKLAAKGTPFESAIQGLTGMTSLAYAKDDPVGLLRTLVEYSKKTPALGFKSGLVEGQDFDADGLDRLSKMPSKIEVQAKLLYLINAPAQQLMGVLKASARDLASIVDQAVEKEKFAS